MKKRIRLLYLLFTLIILISVAAVSVFAANKTALEKFSDNSDVQAYQNAIADLEAKQKDLKNKLKEVQADCYSTQQAIAYYSELIASTEEKINATKSLIDAFDRQIVEKENEIISKEDAIARKESEIESTRERFLTLIRVQYENSNINIISIVLGSNSIEELLTNAENMGNILKYNSNLLEKYKSEKQELQDMKDVLISTKNELEESRKKQLEYGEKLKAEEAALVLQKGDSTSYLNSLKKTEAEITAQYEKACKEEEEENQRLQELLEQLAKKAENEYVGGKFIWPVDTSIKRISSGYGYRTYYYYGKKVTDFHRGIDIPSATGTDIYAVQTGKVVVATKHSSYGNYILIDHGGGISTLYAHCSKLLVKVGDKVKQGDQIAEMGSTGNSTGPHLHIEVRVNGKHEDPIANGWLVQPK